MISCANSQQPLPLSPLRVIFPQMEITVEELTNQPYELISYIDQGDDLTILHNGKAYAKIIPLDDKESAAKPDDSENDLFGLWKDRFATDNDVAFYVRQLRQGRKL